MTALALATQPAYPLGKPADRDRFGMTPEQAFLYGWLVKNKPHNKPFAIGFRTVAPLLLTKVNSIHRMTAALCERGWLQQTPVGKYCIYSFVHPVMVFKEPRGHG